MGGSGSYAGSTEMTRLPEIAVTRLTLLQLQNKFGLQINALNYWI
jgi:hypothetical protein